jgi:hypothetical protein
VGPYFNQSPVTRYAWSLYHESYRSDTARILEAPYGDKLKGWDWRTNNRPGERPH